MPRLSTILLKFFSRKGRSGQPFWASRRVRAVFAVGSALLFSATTLLHASADQNPLLRPQVVDRIGGFSQSEFDEIDGMLRSVARKEEIDVRLYMLEGGVADLAREFLECPSRASDACRAFVGYAPGTGLQVWLGGPLLDRCPPEELQQSRILIQKLNTAQSLPQQAKQAAVLAVGQIRTLRDRLLSVGDPLSGRTADPISIVEPPRKLLGMRVSTLVAFGSVALIVVMVIIYGLWLWLRRRQPTPRYFPKVQPRMRFQGTHTGGNNALISFGSKVRR